MQREQVSEYAVGFPEAVARQAVRHLLQHARQRKLQEDVCFGLWYPGSGARRLSAVVERVLLPEAGDRILSGNVSFTEAYFRRTLTAALKRKAGIALMHSHLGPGWQDLSLDDQASEASFAGRI